MATAIAAIGAKTLFAGGAAIAGGLIGARGSKEAVEVGVEGQEEAARINAATAAQARGDVQRLFGTADIARQGGFSSALDFLSGAPAAQIAPFQQGNVAAQQQIARGLPQIQNALLGLPTDLSGFQAQQIGRPADFNFDLSSFGPQQPAAAASAQQQFQTQDPLTFLDPITQQSVNIPFNIDQFENPNFQPEFQTLGGARRFPFSERRSTR